MVYREVHRVELRELLRRWQAGESIRTIARAMGLARNTVGKYLKAAEALGLTVSGPPATDDQLTQLLA
ncbi:MAG: helix-turn-helix domain-containing protein [Chloroflexota bacterium]|jgi:predicted transcriptional regulator